MHAITLMMMQMVIVANDSPLTKLGFMKPLLCLFGIAGGVCVSVFMSSPFAESG